MKKNDNLPKKPTSCHIEYNCKTVMPCGMLMSFAITLWLLWLGLNVIEKNNNDFCVWFKGHDCYSEGKVFGLAYWCKELCRRIWTLSLNIMVNQ
jgi:hypothetical protein